ncbi:MAG: CBS domain-containing protein [Alphaproteobacteria bacterium]|nr:CBS domain-containing protein [Alphaproteobacteria bacterium]
MIVASLLNTKGRDVFSIAPGASVSDAARYLRDKGIGAALVLDQAGAAAGVFSERDLVNAIADQGNTALSLTVGDLMTKDVVSCSPRDPIPTVMATMTERRVRHLPVIDGGKVVGVVSIGDVVKSRIAEAETEAEALKAYIASG